LRGCRRARLLVAVEVAGYVFGTEAQPLADADGLKVAIADEPVHGPPRDGQRRRDVVHRLEKWPCRRVTLWVVVRHSASQSAERRRVNVQNAKRARERGEEELAFALLLAVRVSELLEERAWYQGRALGRRQEEGLADKMGWSDARVS